MNKVFDITKYKLPETKEIDLKATQKNFEIFLTEYETARERVGQSRVPKITQSFSSIPASTLREFDGDAERFVVEREMNLPAFYELHNLFMSGYYSISHNKQEITDRRRQIFMHRYVNALAVATTADRMFIGRSIVADESKTALMQFCKAIGLLVYKKPLKGAS